MRYVLLVFLLGLAACSEPQANEALPTPKAEGEPVALRNASLLLNGDFAQGTDHWALAGMGSGADVQAGRRGGKDLGLSLHATSYAPTHLALQDVSVPEQVTAATARVSYRMGGTATSQLRGLQIGLGALQGDQFVPLVLLASHTMQNLPSSGWQDATHTLTPAECAQLAELAAPGKRAIVWIQLVGHDVRVHVDDFSLHVTGRRNPPALPGSLVYVARTPGKPFEVRASAPDGATHSVLFTAPREGNTKGLAWSPDRSRVVFSSDHEMAWSPFTADLYELSGAGVRRLTNAPTQADLVRRDLPTGGVTLTIENLNNHAIGPVSVFVQGTKVLGSVSLTAHGDATVTLPEVADLGPGVLQTIAARVGSRTTIAPVGVDVRAGATVVVPGTLTVGALHDQQATSPSFHHSGKHLALSLAGLRTLPIEGGVPTRAHVGNLMGSRPVYAPGDGRLLYVGMGGIWLLRPGVDQAEKVAAHPSGGLADAPAWLPDGSGFVYTASTMHPTLQTASTQIYLKRFDQSTPTQISSMFGLHAGDLAISPDGKYVAFRRAGAQGTVGELWVLPLEAPTRAWPVVRGVDVRHIAWR